MSPEQDAPPAGPGLRERKKGRTRAAIQETAIGLFTRNGYRATTMEQIAAEAEVSERTVYRYFPTKDSLVVTDDEDEALLSTVRALLRRHPPVEAVRRAVRAVLSEESSDLDLLRQRLVAAEPELQAAMLRFVLGQARLFAAMLASEQGAGVDEDTAAAIAGAVAGIVLITLDWDGGETKPSAQLEKLDRAFALLERGFARRGDAAAG